MVPITIDFIWLPIVLIISLSLSLLFFSRPNKSLTKNCDTDKTRVDDSDSDWFYLVFCDTFESSFDDCDFGESDVDNCNTDECLTDECDTDPCGTGESGTDGCDTDGCSASDSSS